MAPEASINVAPGLNWTTEWKFPPALNHTFLVELATEYAARNDSTRTTVDTLKAAAFQLERPKSPYFGSDKVVVHVGDIIEPYLEPKQTKNRTVGLECLVCLEGSNSDEGIFDACEKYTNQSSTSPFDDIHELSPPRFEYTLPALSRDIEIPEHSVGICFFSLYSADKGYATQDYTVPFPVSQLKRDSNSGEHWRFNASWSDGMADPTISSSPTSSAATFAKSDSKTSLGQGEIAGIVMGVVAGVLIAALLIWTLWRRRMNPKSVGENSDDESRRSVSRNENVESIELRNRRAVEQEEEEAPPAYHEVVRPSPVEERT